MDDLENRRKPFWMDDVESGDSDFDFDFEKAGDNFFSGMYTGIVPLEGSKVYRVNEVDDFWEVVGENTDYVEDPEEAMASNFAFAISLTSSMPIHAISRNCSHITITSTSSSRTFSST